MTLLTLLICVYSAEASWNVLYAGSTPRPVFSPTWSDLDKRRLPKWYEEAKIGILVHWGIYSIAGYGPSSARNTKYLSKYWMDGNLEVTDFMNAKYGKGMSYEDLGRRFKASKYDPEQWAAFFKKAGAKYVILTSKDGDGFALFPSKFSPGWNSKDIGPKQDLVGSLKRSCQRQGLEFGLYYHLIEWFEPDNLKNVESTVVRTEFHERVGKTNTILNPYFMQRVVPELEQLVRDYEPKILWADGEQTVLTEYLNMPDFLAWLYNESPVGSDVVINDRWQNGTRQHHGDFFTSPNFNDTGKFREETDEENYRKIESQEDVFNPRTLKAHKWEHLISIDKMSLGFRQDKYSQLYFMDSEELIETVVITVSCGGNVLINIGATHEGQILNIFQKPLIDLGKWLKVNGEAIYGTSPWRRQNETNGLVWYTCKTNKPYNGQYPIAVPFQPDIYATYAIILEWPEDNILKVEALTQNFFTGIKTIKMLGNPGNVTYYVAGNETVIILPKRVGKFAWTLKFSTNLDEDDQDEEDQEEEIE